MPSERFRRLSEEKKKVIRDAAIKEFIRVPYDKASINKMIQSAEISRGSFYTYFEDKADVLSFLLEDARVKGEALAQEILDTNQGDIWMMMAELLEHGIQYCSSHDMFRLYRNITMHPEVEEILLKDCRGEHRDECCDWLYSHVDLSQFRCQDPQTLEDVLMIIMGILGEAIGQLCQDFTKVEEVKEAYKRRLDILKWGVCKDNHPQLSH